VDLNQSTIELLQSSNYNEHILPILLLGENGSWNDKIVTKRTERILELVWDTVIKWIE
jgi:hypothetical protein